MKSPPEQLPDDVAREQLEEFIAGGQERSDSGVVAG
jgi:myo-inositol-1-phosphate synthase